MSPDWISEYRPVSSAEIYKIEPGSAGRAHRAGTRHTDSERIIIMARIGSAGRTLVVLPDVCSRELRVCCTLLWCALYVARCTLRVACPTAHLELDLLLDLLQPRHADADL